MTNRAQPRAAQHSFFPSPCKGEDQGEGPVAALFARFKIPLQIVSDLPGNRAGETSRRNYCRKYEMK